MNRKEPSGFIKQRTEELIEAQDNLAELDRF